MSDDPFAQRHRRTIRLREHDYSKTSAYFVTICTWNRASLFGQIVDGRMRLGPLGTIAEAQWARSADIRCELSLDIWIVMPNHVHGIVFVQPESEGERASGRTPLQTEFRLRPGSLGAFVAGYKAAVTTAINRVRGTPGIPIWQRNYHEHVIRNDQDLQRIREYITNNPARWSEDRYYQP